jgi:hypothetical protein
MKVWELRCANINDYPTVVASREALFDGVFDIDGSPLDWKAAPVVEYNDYKSRRKKTLRPMADVSVMGVGALVLNQRAHEVLASFFEQFGQLLPIQTAGGAEWRWFYNVTNLVKCVDMATSEKSATGVLSSEAFYDINVPRHPAVFKDPQTAKMRIYVNDPGKSLIDGLVAEAGLTGIECAEPKRWVQAAAPTT